MILRRGEEEPSLAVGERDDRRLLALHAALDQHPLPRRTQSALAHESVDRADRLAHRVGDHHPLPRREPIGLDHDRRADAAHMGGGGVGIGEDLGLRGRDPAREHEALGERLRSLEAGRRRGRTEDRDSRRRELVGKAEDQGLFGTDDHEIGPALARQGDEPVHVGGRDRVAAPEGGDPRVSRRRLHRGDVWMVREHVRERVLAPAPADDQNLQRIPPPP